MTMTPRDRLHAVLSGEPVDAFPVVIPYLDIFLRDHWRDVTDIPWWAVYAGDIDANLQALRHQQEKLGLDWVPVFRNHPRAWRERHRVELRDGNPSLIDDATGNVYPLTEPPVGGEQHLVRAASVHTEEQALKAVRVTPAAEMVADGSFDLARAVIETLGRELFVVSNISTPFWNLYFHLGFNDLMVNLVERPRLVETLLERLTLRQLEWVRAHAAVGYDGIWFEDCYAGADLISPEQFRRFVVPSSTRVVEEINRLGMKSIYYFCGEVDERLEDLVKMKPHAIALEESKKGFVIDIAEIDEGVGDRACLFGNFDAITLLERGDERDIAVELGRQTAIGHRRGRFVSCLGSPVTPRTSVERVRAWVEMAQERSLRRP